MMFIFVCVVKMWSSILVSAAGFINNSGMFECSVAGIQLQECRMDGRIQNVSLCENVHMATVCITSLQNDDQS